MLYLLTVHAEINLTDPIPHRAIRCLPGVKVLDVLHNTEGTEILIEHVLGQTHLLNHLAFRMDRAGWDYRVDVPTWTQVA